MLKMLIVFLLLAMGSSPGVGQDADELRKAYLTQVLKLDITKSEDRAAAQNTLKQYAQRFIAQLKAQGDVKGYLLAEQDFKALDLEKAPTQARHPQVRKLLVAYGEELAKAEAKHARNFQALNRHYAARLKELVKSLMAENRIADASNVQDEIDTIGKLGNHPPGKSVPRAAPSPIRYTPWMVETVDNLVDIGLSWPSLSHEPSGHPAISYRDENSQNLKYAAFDGSRWETTTVDSISSVGWSTSLAHGPRGRPAIAYCDTSNKDLKYATFNGTNWVTTIVDSEGVVGGLASLSHGPNGEVAIAYRDLTNEGLKYAVLDGAKWVAITVDVMPRRGISLSHGLNREVAIAYRDDTTKNLKYTAFDGANWVTTTVDRQSHVGYYPSLRHGPAGHPAIAYRDDTSQSLKYAAFDGATWQIETVDNRGDVGRWNAMSHGPSGHPAISYWDVGNRDLRYAAFDGATWQVETVDSKRDVGLRTALSHGPGGEVAITYYDATNKNLKIATKRPFD